MVIIYRTSVPKLLFLSNDAILRNCEQIGVPIIDFQTLSIMF